MSVTLLATVFIQVANLSTSVLAARLLGPEGRGELAAVLLWPMIFGAVGLFGLRDAVVYFCARETEREDAREVIAVGHLLALAYAPLPWIAAWLLFPLLYGQYSEEVQQLALVYSAFIPISILVATATAYFQAVGQLFLWNLTRTVPFALYMIGMLLVWGLGWVSVTSLALPLLVGHGLTLAWCLWVLFRRGMMGVMPPRRRIKPMAWYGLRTHYAAMGRVANQWLDQAIVSLVMTATDLGYYVVAVTISRAFVMFGISIEMLAFPAIAREAGTPAAAGTIGRFMRFGFYGAVIGGLCLILIVPWLLRVLFGPGFGVAAWPSAILIIATWPWMVKIVLSSAYKAHDMALDVGKAETVGLAVMAVTMPALIVPFGINGAATSILCVHSVTALMLLRKAKPAFGVDFAALFRPSAEDFAYVLKLLRRRAQPAE